MTWGWTTNRIAADRAEDWRARGACRDHDPEVFFPVGSSGVALVQIEQAKAVCRGCDVEEKCLAWALDNQPYGVAGGLSEEERRAVNRGDRRPLATVTDLTRRRPAAGTYNKENHVDYRTTERLLNAVQTGAVERDVEHEYIDRRNSRNVSDLVYKIEARGFLTLGYDGSITVTDAGVAWLNREKVHGRKPTTQVMFQPPAVA